MSQSTRQYDIVVYGATGFTGQQAANWLATHAPANLRWTIAGRDEARLRAVAPSHPYAPIVADAQDLPALDALAHSARCVLSTAGPYSKYGSNLFAACARAGTDYVDITGETPWVREMIDKHHTTAQASGATMVPFCGFDSVPSDMGAWMLVEHLRSVYQEGCTSVMAGFSMAGGVNGGTLDSALTMGETDLQNTLSEPFLLNPRPPDGDISAHLDRTQPWSDEHLRHPHPGKWLAPFFMAPVNTRVVRRSAALWAEVGHPYGHTFAYQEGLRMRNKTSAWAAALGLGAATVVLRTRIGRSAVRQFAVPPGKGPTPQQMDGGYFAVDLRAVSESGRVVHGRIQSQGDPGNRSTVRMACAAAITLTSDRERLPLHQHGAGVLTPATALGAPYLDRLRALGMTFAVTE